MAYFGSHRPHSPIFRNCTDTKPSPLSSTLQNKTNPNETYAPAIPLAAMRRHAFETQQGVKYRDPEQVQTLEAVLSGIRLLLR